MMPVAHAVHRLADIVGRVFGRLAAVIVGFIMMVLGLAMTAAIVILPAGVVVGLLGVAIFVGGIFARDDRKERTGS
jgi:hypothetical protein